MDGILGAAIGALIAFLTNLLLEVPVNIIIMAAVFSLLSSARHLFLTPAQRRATVDLSAKMTSYFLLAALFGTLCHCQPKRVLVIGIIGSLIALIRGLRQLKDNLRSDYVDGLRALLVEIDRERKGEPSNVSWHYQHNEVIYRLTGHLEEVIIQTVLRQSRSPEEFWAGLAQRTGKSATEMQMLILTSPQTGLE